MTKNRDRKQLVRERMGKTGESYATARRQLDQSPAPRVAPKGWSLRGETPHAYELYVERIEGPDGQPKTSACVRSRAGITPTWTTAGQEFLAEDYRGSRIRLSASVRTESIDGGAQLWLRIDENTRMLLRVHSEYVRNGQGWLRRELVIDIDDEATLVLFGMIVKGSGAAWLTDVSIEKVGKDVPVSASRDIPTRPTNLDFSA